MSHHLKPGTRLQDLRLKPVVLHFLNASGIQTLSDLAERSVDDLRLIPYVGDRTIEQLRVCASSAGLEIGGPRDRLQQALHRARRARSMPAAARAILPPLSENSPLADLGPGSTTMRRCFENGILTVGHLRRIPAELLAARIGVRAATDLQSRLRKVHPDPGLAPQLAAAGDAVPRLARPSAAAFNPAASEAT